MGSQKKSTPNEILGCPKSSKEKKEPPKQVLIIPETITSKRGIMLWLLKYLGKSWSKISCERALQLLNIEDTPKNRSYWYDQKSEFKQSLIKNEGDSKYQKPKVSYHNFNESSLYLSDAFSQKVKPLALSKGWIESNSRNHFLMWNEKLGWLKWYPSTGRVRLHCKKPVTEGKILQLVSNAFFNTALITDIKELTAFYRSFYLKQVKLTYDLGKRIPNFKIEFSDGFSRLIVIGGDKSHRNAVEIDYLLLKEAEEHKKLLVDTKQTLNVTNETNKQLFDFLRDVFTPKPCHDNKENGMVI